MSLYVIYKVRAYPQIRPFCVLLSLFFNLYLMIHIYLRRIFNFFELKKIKFIFCYIQIEKNMI